MVLTRPMTNEEFLYWLQTGQLPYSLISQPTSLAPSQQTAEQPPPPQPNPLYQKVQQNWEENYLAQTIQQEEQEKAMTAQGVGSALQGVGGYMLATGNPAGAIISGIGGLFGALGGK